MVRHVAANLDVFEKDGKACYLRGNKFRAQERIVKPFPKVPTKKEVVFLRRKRKREGTSQKSVKRSKPNPQKLK